MRTAAWLPVMTALAASACTGPVCSSADLSPLDIRPAYGVVTSDFITSAVALLGEDGALITEAWIDSGTIEPGLSATLGGDIVLPSTAPPDGSLVLIDRSGDVLTRVSVPSGDIRGQLRLTPTPTPGESAFVSNPQDALALSDGRWVLSRLDPNLNPEAAPLDRGNDVVLLDPSMNALSARISFSPLDVSVTVNGVTTHVYARPEGLAPAGERVVVGLSRLSADFSVAGPGAVAVLGPTEETLEEVPLAGLENCREVRAMPDDPERLLVTCSGPTFTNADGRRASAGLALVRVTADAAVVEATFLSSDHPDLPVITHGAIPLGQARAVAVAMGDLDPSRPDALVEVDLESGAARTVMSSDEPFVLGSGTVDASGSTLLVPDAAVGVRRFSIADMRELPEIDTSPCRGLGARQVRRL